MANNQSQSSQSQSQSSTKPQTGGSSTSSSKPQSSANQSSSASTSTPASSSAVNAGNRSNGDMIEETIARGVRSLIQTLEPQLNRIGTQIVNRAMSRGQDLADTGVKRMQDQPWYMVGGALALVAVGVGLLFAFEGDAGSRPDFSSSSKNVQ